MSDGNRRRPSGTRAMPADQPLLRAAVAARSDAVERDRARVVGRCSPAMRAEQGRLAGAVRADDREDLALADLEADVA